MICGPQAAAVNVLIPAPRFCTARPVDGSTLTARSVGGPSRQLVLSGNSSPTPVRGEWTRVSEGFEMKVVVVMILIMIVIIIVIITTTTTLIIIIIIIKQVFPL